MTQHAPSSTKLLPKLGLVIVAAASAGLVWWLFSPTNTGNDPIVAPAKPNHSVAAATLSSESSSSSLPAEISNTIVTDEPAAAATTQTALTVVEEPDVPKIAPTNPQISLNDSDQLLKARLQEMKPNPLSLLTNEHLVRKIVRAVNALDDGNLVTQYRPTVQPVTPFEATQTSEKVWRFDEKSYARYTPYIDMAEGLGADQIIALYQDYQPLINEAFNELGTPKDGFDQTLRGALQVLLNTPELDQPLALVRPSVMYQYQDPQLEALPAAQKLLIRMGPENRTRIKALCEDILKKLPQD